MDSNSYPLAKELERAAPGLCQELARKIHTADMDLCAVAYQYGAQNGALDELGLKRKPNSSFNPRPARLASIIIKETGVVDIQLIQAAFLLGAKLVDHTSFNPVLKPAFEICSCVTTINDNLVTNKSLDIQKLSQACETLFLANWLDFFRHLHLTSFKTEEKFRYYTLAIKITAELPTHTTNQQIGNLLKFWTETQQRNYT